MLRCPHRSELLLRELPRAEGQQGSVQVPDLQDVAAQALPQEKGREVWGEEQHLAQGSLWRRRSSVGKGETGKDYR